MLGEAKGVTANVHVSNSVKPWFCRARIVLHALEVKVEQAMQQLINQKSLNQLQCQTEQHQ